MSQIKKLAGQTAYYGISSILGRVLNFLLLPIWTSRLIPEEYGIVNYVYASVALCLILYTFGMETAFFRFSVKGDKSEVYNNSATAVILVSAIISGFFFLSANGIANFLGEGVQPEYVQYMSAILFIDAAVAIPFAKLRQQEKALKFALIKTTVISLTIIFNLLFLFLLPDIFEGKYITGLQSTVVDYYNPDKGIGYIFIANLAANLLYLPLLWKEIFSIRLKIKWTSFKPMLLYALPILFMGLGGMFNEQGYSIILKNISIDPSIASSSEEALGKFSSVFKLSVIMMLGIQAFRYAAEPFFFNHSEDKKAPQLFARVMHYFLVFNIVVLVAVALNIELISDLFLRRPEYKEALYVLPILLLAKLFYGVYVNLSVWFKLKDKTIYGTYYALIGSTITLIGNIILIPIVGYYGSAIASLLCYCCMALLCYLHGKKEFPIPYKFKRLFIYLLIAIGIIYASNEVAFNQTWLKYLFGILVSAIFGLIMFWKEGRKIDYKTPS